MLRRSRPLQIYVKPGIHDDDVLINVWETAQKSERPQDIFRAILKAGLFSMYQDGTLPDSIIDNCNLDEFFAKKRKRINKNNSNTFTPEPIYIPVPVQAAPTQKEEPIKPIRSHQPTVKENDIPAENPHVETTFNNSKTQVETENKVVSHSDDAIIDKKRNLMKDIF